jgi:hypothetical protein
MNMGINLWNSGKSRGGLLLLCCLLFPTQQKQILHLCPKIQKILGNQLEMPNSSTYLDLTWDAKHGICRKIDPWGNFKI